MSDDVILERRGRLGVLMLNRPEAINALTHDMVLTILHALDEWEGDDSVATVLIAGAGERGLCAGGDIVSLYQAAKTGEAASAERFWADEYQMNSRLSRYPKPVVAIQDGIVLGGGVGISAHCSHRIVTERSRIGLPEVGIGFVPDVGATWLLSRSPGDLGTAVALTARNVGPSDAIELGLSDFFVPSDRLPLLVARLEQQDPSSAVQSVVADRPDSELATARSWIDGVFAGDDVGSIAARLSERDDDDGFLRGIRRASPVAAAVTLASLRRAGALDSLERCLEQEYRVSVHALHTHDFLEGVRAQVIDKDRKPAWSPNAHDQVSAEQVKGYFAVPVSGGLQLTLKGTPS